ncbi:hypothetical protein KJE20_07702 [Pyrenophora tritici-repentis]|nr:hypothetical protein KJE20_07702 [Pyrenophora tritici-repentis]
MHFIKAHYASQAHRYLNNTHLVLFSAAIDMHRYFGSVTLSE